MGRVLLPDTVIVALIARSLPISASNSRDEHDERIKQIKSLI